MVDALHKVYAGILLIESLQCRKIGASKEQAQREQLAEEMANRGYSGTQDDDDDEMEF